MLSGVSPYTKLLKNPLPLGMGSVNDVTDEPEFKLTEELNSMIGELVDQIITTYLDTGEEKKGGDFK